MKKNILPITFIVISLNSYMYAHGAKEHTKSISSNAKVEIQSKKNKELNTTKINKQKLLYDEINISYLKNVKPIFEKKCFDCHAEKTRFPWYANIPGIKQMIAYDIKEAKKHLNMKNDFPFISHESPLKDLKSLQEVTQENDMPPFRYILGHWDARLTDNEKKKILLWSKKSIERMEED